MIKRATAVFMACIILLCAAACGAKKNADVNGNSPKDVIKLAFKAFKDVDKNGIEKYFFDQVGHDSEDGVGVFSEIPEDDVYVKLLRAQYSNNKVTINGVSVAEDGKSAVADIEFTTINLNLAYQMYINAARLEANRITTKRSIELWESVFKDPELPLVTSTEVIKLMIVNGAWKVVADSEFELLIVGGNKGIGRDEESPEATIDPFAGGNG